MGVENLYLVYKHYGIRENDSGPRIIQKAAKVSYLDFCRRVSFQNSVPVNKRDGYERAVENLLSERIPPVLESIFRSQNGQEVFDALHHELCQAIIEIYADVGGLSYGIAQRWLNLTLMNLEVIQTSMGKRFYPYAGTRWYFHAPVDRYLLEVAASKSDKFKHGLKLKAAPIRHDRTDGYQMGWFSAENTQPFESWEYPEYMEFQLSIRRKLGLWVDSPYYDPLDWAFQAFTEGAQARNSY